MPDAFALFVFGAKLVFLIAALGAGGSSFVLAFGGPLARRIKLVWGCSAALVAALAYGVYLTAINAQLGGTWAAALDPVTFGWIWPSHQAKSYVLMAGLVAAMVGLVWSVRPVAGFAVVLISVSLALSGHTSSAEPVWLSRMAVSIHVLAASFWVMAPLLLWPRVVLDEDAACIRHFSAVAVWLVPIVFVAGAYLALRLSGGAFALFTTTYGQLLLAKLTVATVALGLGAINKQLVSRRFAKDPADAQRLLRLTLTTDIVLFLAVFAIIAWATTISGPSG